MSTQQNISKKKRSTSFNEINDLDDIALITRLSSGAPPSKRVHHPQQLQHPKHTLEHPAPLLNRRASHPLPDSPLSRNNAREQVKSWIDYFGNIFFRATEQIKRARRFLPWMELLRAARNPWRRISLSLEDEMVIILD
ncbi:PREDICTED: uncharacterized protein LOC108750196 [Trachymyrmex septentrionalis]|nr:PREDICTED: uncharacterized protein LOC108750196 [Trachymyrmex septentrionalis]